MSVENGTENDKRSEMKRTENTVNICRIVVLYNLIDDLERERVHINHSNSTIWFVCFFFVLSGVLLVSVENS